MMRNVLPNAVQGNWVEYSVKVTKEEERFNIAKRYNDFVELDEYCKSVFADKGKEVPAGLVLPPKTRIRQYDEASITLRKAGLNTYLSVLCETPDLIVTSYVQKWLSPHANVPMGPREERSDDEEESTPKAQDEKAKPKKEAASRTSTTSEESKDSKSSGSKTDMRALQSKPRGPPKVTLEETMAKVAPPKAEPLFPVSGDSSSAADTKPAAGRPVRGPLGPLG